MALEPPAGGGQSAGVRLSSDERAEGAGVGERLRRAFRYFATAFVVVGVVIAVLFGYVLGSLRPDQTAYSSGDRAVQLAHQAMIDQETGLRGYLLLQDPTFLGPYRQGVEALATNNDEASRRLGGRTSIAPLLLDMRVAEQAWISQWALIVVANRAPTEPAALRSFLDEGKVLFDAYREREQVLSDFLNHTRDSLQRREGIAFGVGLAVVLVVGAALGVVMERQRRLLRRMLVAPVDGIVSTTERIAGGDFDARVASLGPAEFRRIATSVNAMGDALVQARDDASARRAVIEHQAEQLRKILSMAREIAGSLNLRYVLRSVATSAINVSGFPHIVIWLCDEDNETSLTPAFDSSARDGVPVGPRDGAEIGIGVIGHAVKYGRATIETTADEPSVEVHPERPLRTLAVPLVVGAHVTGAIEFVSPTPAMLTEGSLEVLETLAIHAAAAIEASRLHQRVELLGRTDGLTSLANRRSLDTDLTLECERSTRYHRPLALILFDVDHFKQFNDTFGHQRGDEVLQELAATVRGQLRATDTAYRYGGEEFVVLARETTPQQAAILAERLRRRVQEHFAAHGTLSPITASFGIGLIPPEQSQPGQVIAAADAALYLAKGNGRNRVEVARYPPAGL